MLSLHSVFIAASWLIGLLGVGGVVAAIAAVVFLAPAAVQAIVVPIFKRFIECTWCIVVVVFVLTTTGAYWVGHHEAESECRAEELRAELRNKTIDADNATKAKEDETKRADTIEETANAQHERDIASIAALKARGHACPFDDIDSGGMPDNKHVRFPLVRRLGL
jgi:hypothetical protein